MGGARSEENVSAKGKKKEKAAWFPQQGSYGSRQTGYKEKAGQGQKKINSVRGQGAKKAAAARKLAVPASVRQG